MCFTPAPRGNISWFDFAVEIFRQAKIEIRVLPQTSAELGTARLQGRRFLLSMFPSLRIVWACAALIGKRVLLLTCVNLLS